nr:MAG TPA: baseplate protein [Caudoviricetes sp.]
MPRESTNLKLKLYNAITDAKEFAVDWFNNIFDYTNSNWVKIDDAYGEVKDKFNNYPTKDGTGATGDWDINAKSATNDSAGQQIDATYIKDLRPTGDKIIITKGNNETTTIDGAAPKGYTLTETIPSPSISGQTWFHVGGISNTSDGDLIKVEINCPTTVSTENTSIAYSRSITLFIHDLAQTDDSDLSTAYIFSYIVYDDKLKSSDVDIENGLATRNYFYLIPTSGGDGQSNAELWINTDSTFFNSIINVSLSKKDNWGYVLKYSANAPSVDQAITPYSKTSVVTDTNYATKTKAGIVQIGNNITVGDKGLISLIKDNIDGALGYEAAEKMSLVSVTIPTTGWSQDDNSAYPNYIDIVATGITRNDCVALVISPDSNAIAKKCYFTSTEALPNYLRVRSRNIPTEPINAFYYVIREDILMSFGQTPIGGAILPPATTTKLGGVIVGDGLKVSDNGVLSVKSGELYPVGSIYQTVRDTSPAALFGGTWEQIASNRVLMGTTDSSKAGFTVEAGLPNITGSYVDTGSDQTPLRGTADGAKATGAFHFTTFSTSWAGFSKYSGTAYNLFFDASMSNSIYGSSDTVQPPAYYIYIWKRVS